MSTDFLAPLVQAYEAQAAEANAIVAKVTGGKAGEQAKSLKEWRETSEDERAKRFRENVEKAQAAILKWTDEINKIGAEELKFPAPLTDEEIKAHKEQYKEKAGAARKAHGLITDVAATLSVDAPSLTPLLNFGSGKPAGERVGSTGTRTRWSKVEYKLDGGDVVECERLSDVVASIKKVTGHKVSAQDISSAIFDAAGTTDPDKISSQEIDYSQTGEDKVTHVWSITVYRDPKQATASDTDNESDESDDVNEDNESE